MVYSTECGKWKAYQFSDPFAAGSFFVCNKINKSFCRPDCDARARTNLKSEIKFVNTPNEAIDLGFTPCSLCDPLSLPPIDVNLLVNCVATINRQIGFLPPLLDENEEKNNQKIKENIIESKKTNEEQILQAFGGLRRSSVPVINYDGKFSKDFEATSLSKNDSDHYRLVDLACRHLALAAAMNIFQPQAVKSTESPEDAGNSPGATTNGKKRRRRGGVLGFKELAAKSKLSAWHFHRVFKSVTGLTPKTYGDKCWEFIKNFKDSGEYTSFSASPSANKFGNYYQTPVSSHSNSPVQPQSVPSQSISESQPALKKVKIEDNSVLDGSPATQSLSQTQALASDVSPHSQPQFSLNTNNIKYSVPQQASFDFSMPMDNHTDFLEDEGSQFNTNSRAFSAPDLTFFNSGKPSTLFGHSRTLFGNDQSSQQYVPSHSQQYQIPQQHPSSISQQTSPLQGSSVSPEFFQADMNSALSSSTSADSIGAGVDLLDGQNLNEYVPMDNDDFMRLPSMMGGEDDQFGQSSIQHQLQQHQPLMDGTDMNQLSLNLSPELLSSNYINL